MPPEERSERTTPDVWTWLIEIAVACGAFLLVIFFLGYYFEIGYERYRAILERIYDVWASVRAVVEVIIILASIGIIGFIVTIFRRFRALNRSNPVTKLGGKGIASMKKGVAEKEITNEWEEVKKLADSQSPSDWNMAILRADVLLDDVLQRFGHAGTTVKERLDTVDPTMIPSIERLYSAHRLRNMIAHDPTTLQSKETLVQALRSYEQGFKELRVLKVE